MRRILGYAIAIAALWPSLVFHGQAPKALEIYFVDVEGGQATLLVSPSGQSLAIDTGSPGGRDAPRIADVARLAGVSALDYQLITHYHSDHVGGVPELASLLPIRTFIDHGPNLETPGPDPTTNGLATSTARSYEAYLPVRDKARHIHARPGDRLPMTGIDVRVVSGAQTFITEPLAGAGTMTPACGGFVAKDEQRDRLLGGENKASLGTVIAYGRFRMIDLGDLTWNAEHALACPRNLVGTVDLYLTTHHGLNASGLPLLVHALRPRIAVMNNGSKKGGHPDTFDALRQSPGLEDVWQLHYALGAGERNSADALIANVDEATAHYIKVTAQADGSFAVTNSRTGHRKTYPPRR